jgi:hypothetical protein
MFPIYKKINVTYDANHSHHEGASMRSMVLNISIAGALLWRLLAAVSL